MTAMELGILSLGDIQTSPATGQRFGAMQRIDEIIGYAALADDLGLDLFALGEHHTLDFAVSSPAVVLAAIAARTRSVRLTSAVTVLSVLDPVRVYQDFATLDLLSHGRAEIIAGRSAFAEPFAIFGQPIEEYDQLFAEKLTLLLELVRTSHVTWSGRYRPPLVDAPIAPRAHQQPLPVWAGVGGSPASAQRAGHLGLPMVLGFIGGSFAHARRTVDIYRAAGERAGHPEKLRVGISTHFFAGATPSAARAVFPYWSTSAPNPRPTGGFASTGSSSRPVPSPARRSWWDRPTNWSTRSSTPICCSASTGLSARSTGAVCRAASWRSRSPVTRLRSRRPSARPWARPPFESTGLPGPTRRPAIPRLGRRHRR
jgi:alkanesulfonate monooxygenase SsuD/methylene tetrahydromethanopterin reductase-like flavin-dependent oxidoreductase (luciferase family)